MNLILNVIFPAFLAPVIPVLFMPILAIFILGIEVYVYYINGRLSDQDFQYYWIIAVIAANLVSSLVGIALSGILPSGLSQDLKNGPGPEANVYFWLSWPVWWSISILVEYSMIWLSTRRNPIRNLFRANLFANTVTYAVLLLASYVLR